MIVKENDYFHMRGIISAYFLEKDEYKKVDYSAWMDVPRGAYSYEIPHCNVGAKLRRLEMAERALKEIEKLLENG